ncbi:MAG: hypothetical protein LBM23_05970 [Propionibacteriaceae bacterium]|jgi:spermidine synthase|nr:hypothetical protein [Propionibacteriaceae bacterium]
MDDNTLTTLARATEGGYEIVLRRRASENGDVDELIVNGAFAMDSAETTSEVALADALGPQPGHVLVGGLGLGFTAAQLLDLGAAHLDIVELSGCLIDWANDGLTETLDRVAHDPRVTLHHGDVIDILSAPPALPGMLGPWDGICLDTDNGPDFLLHEANQTIYTTTGIRSALNHLVEGGRLSLWSQGPSKELWYDLMTIDSTATERLVGVQRGNRRTDYAIYTVTARSAG